MDLLIATDCVSEGQNLQDCDFRSSTTTSTGTPFASSSGSAGSTGSWLAEHGSIQLVNFWPNIELEEYINLEQRVSGRMVLLDISATGEENIIEHQSGDQMNDLEYRRKQLLKLQDAIIDLEDLSSGVSIAGPDTKRLPHRPGGIPERTRGQARVPAAWLVRGHELPRKRRSRHPARRHLLPARRRRSGTENNRARLSARAALCGAYRG